MKQEKAFSRNGFYGFMLESNLLLHRQVARAGARFLSDWLSLRKSGEPVRVLDLACGGSPVSIADMFRAFPQQQFQYVGIDVNPDQIIAARAFEFPDNVREKLLLEGNAWDFSEIFGDEVEGKFDFVFSGMNLHHGSHAEIYCLLKQVKEILPDEGLFLNHDLYRPDYAPYESRPQVNPLDEQEVFAMIALARLSDLGGEKFSCKTSGSPENEAWKPEFLDRYRQTLVAKGASEAGIAEVLSHVANRDYPISISELQQIVDDLGFKLQVLEMDGESEPLAEYFSMVAVRF
jgi:SAM-dependent methyltransferase